MRNLYLFTVLGVIMFMSSVSLFAQANVAILRSDDDAKNYFALHYPACGPDSSYLGADEYKRYYLGWKYVLENPDDQSEIIPIDIILDKDLTEATLGKYAVLILSNTPSISDDHAKAIRQWVTRGGRLIATFGSGYKDIQFSTTDLKQADTMKLQEGGTNGLHQLWKDPLGKMVTTMDLACSPESLAAGDKTCCIGGAANPRCQFVDVTVTRYEGATVGLYGNLRSDPVPGLNVLGYGALGNMLIQRPESSDKVLAFFKFYDTAYDRPAPAIIVSDQAKGRVVYFAFAPEFLVTLNYGLPEMTTLENGGLKDPNGILEPAYSTCVYPLKLTHPWEALMPNIKTLMRETVKYLLPSK